MSNNNLSPSKPSTFIYMYIFLRICINNMLKFNENTNDSLHSFVEISGLIQCGDWKFTPIAKACKAQTFSEISGNNKGCINVSTVAYIRSHSGSQNEGLSKPESC